MTFTGEIIDSGVCHQAIFEDPDGNLPRLLLVVLAGALLVYAGIATDVVHAARAASC